MCIKLKIVICKFFWPDKVWVPSQVGDIEGDKLPQLCLVVACLVVETGHKGDLKEPGKLIFIIESSLVHLHFGTYWDNLPLPWKVDENAGKQDRQEEDKEAESLFLGMLPLAAAERKRVADGYVPGEMLFCFVVRKYDFWTNWGYIERWRW